MAATCDAAIEERTVMPSLMECVGDEVATESLRRDNFDKGDFWIVCDGFTVTLAEQRVGESPSQTIRIPKTTFDFFVKRYTEQQ